MHSSPNSIATRPRLTIGVLESPSNVVELEQVGRDAAARLRNEGQAGDRFRK